MKKVLVILAFIIAVGLVYFLIQSNNGKQTRYSVKGLNNRTVESMSPDITDLKKPPDIPDVLDLPKLIIDFKLKPAKLNLPDSVYWKNSEINIRTIIPSSVRNCDIYLLVNSKKKDMFYRVDGGTYEFKNVGLEKGKNMLEVFYRIGKRRSESTSSIVIRV